MRVAVTGAGGRLGRALMGALADGQAARVRFISRLRGEVKFDSVDALVGQIERDVADTRRALS